MTPKARFTELLQDIEPSTTTISHSVSAHEAMRKFLRNHDSFSDVHVGTYLSGSYKRNTAVRPRQMEDGTVVRPDIDIIAVTSFTLNDAPKVVLGHLYDVVASGYAETKRQARSVGVTTSNVDMDVVPIIQPHGEGSALFIPDRELQTWLLTNPPEHTAWTTRVNEEAGGRFKPLVKLMKWWRRHNPTTGRHPKGFVLECIAAECMDYQETNFGLLFVKTLEGIVSQYQINMTMGSVPLINDPGVSGNSVTSNISYQDFLSFYELAATHAAVGRSALDEDDPDEMTRLWRIIFGPRFPTTKGTKAESLLSTAVAPTPLAFPDRPVKPNKPAGFA